MTIAHRSIISALLTAAFCMAVAAAMPQGPSELSDGAHLAAHALTLEDNCQWRESGEWLDKAIAAVKRSRSSQAEQNLAAGNLLATLEIRARDLKDRVATYHRAEMAVTKLLDAKRVESPLLREAIARSSNKAAVSVGKGLGLSRVASLFDRLFEIKPKIEGSLLLGGVSGAEMQPLAVAEAYAAFVNYGRRPRARFIRELRRPGAPSQRIPVQSEPGLDPLASAIVLQTSRSVTGDIPISGATLGFGKNASGLPTSAQVGGKTGTGMGSNWAVLLHPHLVVAIVIACDAGCELRMTEGFTGGNVAGEAWASFVRRLYPLRPAYFDGSFEVPPGLVQVAIDPVRGCANPVVGGRMEYFITTRMPRPCSGL